MFRGRTAEESVGNSDTWSGVQCWSRGRPLHLHRSRSLCCRYSSGFSNGAYFPSSLNDSHLVCPQVRKYVYHDSDNLDTAFDAGGKVSIGLTATTIVSQWTWSATLLQSSTVASKVRRGGEGVTINVVVRHQRPLLVRGGSHHTDHHLLHPLHHAEDESSGSQDFLAGY